MPNLPRYSLLTIAVFAAMVIAAAQNPPVPTTKSTTTFTEMKSLVGEWEAVQDGVTVKETYALTANGSSTQTISSSVHPARNFTVNGIVTAARTAAKIFPMAKRSPRPRQAKTESYLSG